jgi:transposase
MRDIGVDLHKTSFQCCYLKEDQTEFKKYFISALEDFKKDLRQTDRIAVESTGNSRWFLNQVKDKVSEVTVVNPGQFSEIRLWRKSHC